MIIAVDFDGTLCKECYPNIGEANTLLIEALLERKRLGDKVVLWTCREEKLLEDALYWCKQRGLLFDAVNDNLEEIKRKYQHNSRKITADIYIDDKALAISFVEMQKRLMNANKQEEYQGNIERWTSLPFVRVCSKERDEKRN